MGEPGLIPGWGRSPGEGNGNPLQYSFLENPMDRGVWRATVHGVAVLDMIEATEHVTSTHSFPVLSDDWAHSGSRLCEGLQTRAALSWYKKPNLCWCHENVCKGKRAFHLWPHGVRWHQGITCHSRQVFRGTQCLHNSDKGSPGNCKFDSTYSSHACLWRLGGFELQEKKNEKAMHLFAGPGNECELTEWIHSGDWQVDDNYSSMARAGRAPRRKYHLIMFRRIYLWSGFLAESDWIRFQV